MTTELQNYLEEMDNVNVIPQINTLKIKNQSETNQFSFSTLKDDPSLESFEVENVKINENGNLQAEIRPIN